MNSTGRERAGAMTRSEKAAPANASAAATSADAVPGGGAVVPAAAVPAAAPVGAGVRWSPCEEGLECREPRRPTALRRADDAYRLAEAPAGVVTVATATGRAAT